eukprot:419523-Rhodomonas_salina.1
MRARMQRKPRRSAHTIRELSTAHRAANAYAIRDTHRSSNVGFERCGMLVAPYASSVPDTGQEARRWIAERQTRCWYRTSHSTIRYTSTAHRVGGTETAYAMSVPDTG